MRKQEKPETKKESEYEISGIFKRTWSEDYNQKARGNPDYYRSEVEKSDSKSGNFFEKTYLYLPLYFF